MKNMDIYIKFVLYIAVCVLYLFTTVYLFIATVLHLCAEMTSQHEVLYIYEFVLLFGAYLSPSVAAVTGARSLLSLPHITPGSNTCETFKSLFGLTYRQMQGKTANANMLEIDHITRDKRVKFGLKDTKTLEKIIKTSKTIVILIHGFMESPDGAMVQALSREYLKKDGIKVFALDGRNVISTEYFISTTYARFLGEELGQFLSDLVNHGENASKITLVGHSLGAHIAGVAGKIVQQRTGQIIGRITGLDPARPCFSNMDSDGRLDSSDAVFVDVVHTNAGVLGLKEPVGHVDFYPNGGSVQTGCILTTCHHSRAWELYSESITAPDHFPGRKCQNFTTFKNNRCVRNEVAYLGVVPKTVVPGNYYLTTAGVSPFGLGAPGIG